MTTTILHVEDDASLIQLVEDSFEAFGFRGTYLTATSVAEARAIIDDTITYPKLDLVLSDMTLPDGSGLDVVQCVRANIAREHVPIVILSGDTCPELVNRAYSMGANSFVGKGTRARSIAQTMTALYGHWLRDAKLPDNALVSRTDRFVARAVLVRKRKAQVYMHIAEHYCEGDSEFWMDLALREGNLSNVLTFLRSQLDGRELPAPLLDEAERVQRAELMALDEIATMPVNTTEDAQEVIRAMIANYQPATFARITAELFPIVPVAMSTLCEVAAGMLDDIAGWLEAHVTDPDLRQKAARLRADAAYVRTLPASVSGNARRSAGDASAR